MRLSLSVFLVLIAHSASAAITFDDIGYWVGTGPNRAALVIDFNDAKSPESLVWGYRWSGTATGEDLFAAVVAADPRLFAKRKTFSFGPANLGIGYDTDGDGFAISDGTTFDPGTGIAQGNENQADGATATDPDDHYREGWFGGYFAYYTADANPYAAGGAWGESQVGASARVLTDGGWDGLSFAPNFAGTTPSEPTPVPEPVSIALAAVAISVLARRRCRTIAAMILLVFSIPAQGQPHAVEVIDYQPGTIRSDYRVAGSALGRTGLFAGTSPFTPTPLVATPFNAPWTPGEITGIGAGGRLVVRLGQTAATGAGHTLGVHAGVNLLNVGGDEGRAGNPAATFSVRRADVRVSADGQNWVPLVTDFVFDVPTNAWAAGVTVPANQSTPGTIEADYTKPFTGDLADFNGLTYQQMLPLLDGSAGGTWFDLTNVPLLGVNYVEFTVGADDVQMYVDAVVTVPEPAAVLAWVGAFIVIGNGSRRGRHEST